MRTSAWVTIIGLAGLAIACGDQPTEPLLDREANTALVPGGRPQFATASSGDGYSITTDKDDYQPGDRVVLMGAGWSPGDSLDIVLTDEPQTHAPHEWAVGIEMDGTFSDSTYVVDEGDLNVTFTLVATSRSNGQSLSITFTDGTIQSVALVPGTRSVQPGEDATYTINVDMGGNTNACTVTLSVTGLSAGLVASIPNNVVSTTNTDFSRTLTIGTSGVSPGSYPFTLLAAKGSTCSGNDATVAGTLIIFGNATNLGFGQQPSNITVPNAITPAVTVLVRDASNNIVANSSAPVTLGIGSNPGAGTLSGTITRNAVNGVATFPGLTIDKAGVGYTLTANSVSLSGATSQPFTVTGGLFAQIAFTTPASGGTAGIAWTTQPVVKAQDIGGNTITTGQGSGASIGLAIVSGTGTTGATLTCTTNPLQATAGVAAFGSCRINLAGSGYQLRASTTIAGTTYTATSSAFNVVSADADAPIVACSAPNPTLWYGDNQHVPCTASDAGSGLANAADASFTLSTSIAPDVETATASTPGRNVCDKNGNCAAVDPFLFKVDRKAPAIICGSADGAWHAADASIHCTATDGGSGVATGDDAFDLTTSVADNTETSTASTGSRSVTDIVGNSATAGPVSGNKVDKKAPEVSCGAADGKWHADDVTIHCTSSDGGSGVVAGGASFDLATHVATGTETPDAQTDHRTVADAVGNSVKAGPIGSNQVDKKAPGFTCNVASAAWSADDVTRSCAAADQGSGLAATTPTLFGLATNVLAGREDSDAQTETKDLVDAVGNKVTAGPLGGNKVDKKAPSFSCGSPDGQWHADDVSIACTGSDAGSGFGASNDPTFAFSLKTSVAAGTETGNAPTDTKEISDAVGNKVTAPAIPGNKVDKKAPTFTCDSPDGKWHADDASIGCTGSDGGSGFGASNDPSYHFSLSTNVLAGTETNNASTESKEISDAVNNKVTAPAIAGNMVDKKAPVVTCGQADGMWHGANVHIGCTAGDGGSGLANTGDASFELLTTVAAGMETSYASTGSRNVADLVGNSSTAGPVGGNKVDLKAPVVSLTCPATTTFTLNQPVTASWGASEGGSGFDGPSSGTLTLATNTAGPHSVAVTGGTTKDKVGNLSAASNACDYAVSFIFAGFTTPVDNNGVLNGANSGQAIPLKWTLKDFNGAPVTTLTSVNVTAVTLTCARGATADQIEEYAAGVSGLINQGGGAYQFNWKTPTSYASSCKTLRLDLGEGTTSSPVYHTAAFEFKK
jgi:hypothetical protein